MFRSYNAFMSKSYKVAIWILYPLLACLGCILVQSGCFGLISKSGYNCMVAERLLCYGIVLVEFIVDYCLFSAIWSKSANYMDFFNSSHKGKQLLKDALLFTLIRRILMIMLCSGLNIVIGFLFYEHSLPLGECIRQTILYAIGCYFLSTLFVFIYRLVDLQRLRMLSVLIGYLGSMIVILFFSLILVLKFPFWIWLVILLTVSIMITIKLVKVAVKKVEDSYYDERS